jgi:glucans biosynthesis protein
VLEIVGGKVDYNDLKSLHANVTASKGKIENLVLQRDPMTGGARISFDLITNKEPLIELRGQLMRETAAVSETWIYRWTP